MVNANPIDQFVQKEMTKLQFIQKEIFGEEKDRVDNCRN